jgi:hypothetical protein
MDSMGVGALAPVLDPSLPEGCQNPRVGTNRASSCCPLQNPYVAKPFNLRFNHLFD